MGSVIIRLLSGVCVSALCLCAAAGLTRAETPPAPAMPPPLQTLADQGAQVRYMGKAHGMDSWLTIKAGQEQYF